jgi:hypothetical protein
MSDEVEAIIIPITDDNHEQLMWLAIANALDGNPLSRPMLLLWFRMDLPGRC